MASTPILIAACATTAVSVYFATAAGTAAQGGGQSTANMQVNANVVRKCTIQTQPLAFGSYDPVQANATSPLDGQTTLTVACTKGTTVAIGMDAGSNAAGTTRRMTSSDGSFLTYEAYRDASRTQRWGDTTSDRLDGGVAPSRDPRQFIVYGRIPGSQDVPEGTFQDVVLVTVQF